MNEKHTPETIVLALWPMFINLKLLIEDGTWDDPKDKEIILKWLTYMQECLYDIIDPTRPPRTFGA